MLGSKELDRLFIVSVLIIVIFGIYTGFASDSDDSENTTKTSSLLVK